MINKRMMHCKNKLNEVGRKSLSFEKLAVPALAAIKTCLNGSRISTPLTFLFNAIAY